MLSFKNILNGLHLAILIMSCLAIWQMVGRGIGSIEVALFFIAGFFLFYCWLSSVKFYPAVPFQRAGIEIQFYRSRLVAEPLFAIGLAFYLSWKNIFPLIFLIVVNIVFISTNIGLLYFFALDKDNRNPNTLSGYFEH